MASLLRGTDPPAAPEEEDAGRGPHGRTTSAPAGPKADDPSSVQKPRAPSSWAGDSDDQRKSFAAGPSELPTPSLFEKWLNVASAGEGQVSGPLAVAFFSKSGLPNAVLARVWSVADQTRSGGAAPFFVCASFDPPHKNATRVLPDRSIDRASLIPP